VKVTLRRSILVHCVQKLLPWHDFSAGVGSCWSSTNLNRLIVMGMLDSSPFQFATSSPSDVRHHYVDLLSILFLFHCSFAVNFVVLSVATRVQRSGTRHTCFGILPPAPPVLNVLSHVVISLATPSVSFLAALVNDHSAQVT